MRLVPPEPPAHPKAAASCRTPKPCRPSAAGCNLLASQQHVIARDPSGAWSTGEVRMAGKERADLDVWRDLASKERKAAPPEELVWHTPEGIDVKPLYTRADVEGLDFLDTIPGAFPFLRGPRATMYAGQPWTIRQYAGFSTAEESNAFYRTQPRRRADGALGRLRPRHPPRLRQRPSARRRRCRQGRGGHRLGRGHEDPLRRRAARQDVGVDDHERRRASGAGQLHRRRRGAGRAAASSSPAPSRTTS